MRLLPGILPENVGRHICELLDGDKKITGGWIGKNKVTKMSILGLVK